MSPKIRGDAPKVVSHALSQREIQKPSISRAPDPDRDKLSDSRPKVWLLKEFCFLLASSYCFPIFQIYASILLQMTRLIKPQAAIPFLAVQAKFGRESLVIWQTFDSADCFWFFIEWFLAFCPLGSIPQQAVWSPLCNETPMIQTDPSFCSCLQVKDSLDWGHYSNEPSSFYFTSNGWKLPFRMTFVILPTPFLLFFRPELDFGSCSVRIDPVKSSQ